MTQDDVIRLAKQAGFLTNEIKSYVISPYTFEDQDLYEELEAFAKLVAEHEREACAKIADECAEQVLEHNFSALIAHTIRARKQA